MQKRFTGRGFSFVLLAGLTIFSLPRQSERGTISGT
jgi:hypothetical protein